MGLRKKLSTWIFKTLGWEIVGPLPVDTKKCVVVVYPHTSNWDFPIGILFNQITGLSIGWVGKHTLFKPPFGGLMRALGGRPVVRTGNTKLVDAIAQVFRKEEVFRLCITPEGTRKRTEKLKTGYHFIALEAKVPIVWCAFDWKNKKMIWSEPYTVTDSYEATEKAFHDVFRGLVGYHAEDGYPIPDN